MDTTTIDAITGLVARLGSQRKASAYLGESPGVVSDIVRGRGKHVSLATENRVRAAGALRVVVGMRPRLVVTRSSLPPCPYAVQPTPSPVLNPWR